jgi:hypothetical protein
MGKMLLAMVTKCMEMHVFPNFTSVTIVYTLFNLWMLKGGVDTFTLVINYLIEVWELMHVTVGLLKVNETINLYMAQQLQSLVEKFCLIH